MIEQTGLGDPKHTDNSIHFTLPAKYYTDSTYYQRELELFFLNRWVCAGRADQIPEPGDYFLRELASESIIVTRGDDEMIRAFYNVCRHRGTRLCDTDKGRFAGRISCPYHAWSYGLDGRLLGAPQMSAVSGFRPESFPLHRVHCEIWDGNIFINLSASSTPEPLSEQLGPLPEKFKPWDMTSLRLGRRIVYDVKANWKLIIQNYSECLHCPVIHPALQKLSSFLGSENEPAAASSHYLGGRMSLREGIESMSLSGRRVASPLPGLGDEELRHVYYYSLLPNLLLSLHPDYLMTHTMWPKSEARTEVICEFHFLPEAMERPDFDPADVVEFWDLTNRQDWKVSELSQLGIGSRAYTPGPYSARESLLPGLDQIILDTESSQGLDFKNN